MRVPCTYQGGKQRISSQIVDVLMNCSQYKNTIYYDLCCGSGAISIELVNKGINPNKIIMLDVSSWGAFWCAIGSGKFKKDLFEKYLDGLPNDKKNYMDHMKLLASKPINQNEAELYPILQANSFGGKQICKIGEYWKNPCFRDYWEPTETSIRKSPANPMQPSPFELRRRIYDIIEGMKGIECFNQDIFSILDFNITDNSVVYIDPPYRNTTGYAFGFDVDRFIETFKSRFNVPLFVSEGVPLGKNPIKLSLRGANGGITGTRKEKHQEWLNCF